MTAVVVLVSGSVLMALELLGSRILAPAFGNSIIVWGSLIGVFMSGMALGYFLGGSLADSRPRVGLLATILCLGGASVIGVSFLASHVAVFVPYGERTGSLLAALTLFFVPSTLLGMVSPFAIRLTGAELERLGRVAGRLDAMSTAGSIIGTFATSFWLIPTMGVDRIIVVLGGLLVLLGAVLVAVMGQRRVAVALVLALVAAAGGLQSAWETPGSLAASAEQGPIFEEGPNGTALRVIYRKDSAYHHIRVADGGGIRYLRFDDSYQSAMFLTDPFATVFPYTGYFHLGMALRPEAEEVLFVGLGGGSAPKLFWRDYPDLQVDTVELDPEVVQVAREFFAVPDDPRLTLNVADGRAYLEQSDRQYDLVILDTYFADAIPFHLMTQEFFTVVRERLRPGGYLIANVAGALEGPESRLFRSAYRTLHSVFPTVYVFAVDGPAQPPRVQNLILIAGLEPRLTREQIAAAVDRALEEGAVKLPELATYAGHLTDEPDTADAPILTDAYAPVDNLLRFQANP